MLEEIQKENDLGVVIDEISSTHCMRITESQSSLGSN